MFRFLFDLKDVLPKSNVCVREKSVLSNRVQSRLLKVLKKVLLSLKIRDNEEDNEL